MIGDNNMPNVIGALIQEIAASHGDRVLRNVAPRRINQILQRSNGLFCCPQVLGIC